MPRSFPPDVLVLDADSLLHARISRGKKGLRLEQARRYALAQGTFTPSVVTPDLANEPSLTEALRRLRLDSGKWDKASLLLPDSWFRINLLDVPSMPTRADEASQVVRWSLKRTVPIAPELMRVAWEPVARSGQSVKVLVVSAVDAAITTIEEVFRRAGVELVLIEPIGLNLWNAITVRETDTASTRLFIYARPHEFTTAVFRSGEPLFIRSRNLSGARSVHQEIRLSANYLRESLDTDTFASCHLAGDLADDALQSTVASEFKTQVKAVSLRNFVEDVPVGMSGHEAELTACTGVFTG